MYAPYFGLKDNPFSIAPNPGYLYLSTRHQEALAHLIYGIGENGGFVQLTGEVGTGKTTLIRALLEQHIENLDVALCLNPKLTVNELVASVCDELQVQYPRNSTTLKPLIDALNEHLLVTHAQGRRTVLIIDEAQSLDQEILEQVRLLTNLETHRHKLLRIILVGQPELQLMLERPGMRQLTQRITARYHLMPLTSKETTTYVVHRLKVAGGRSDIFTKGALKTVHRLSHGVPRLINIICDRALLGTYAAGLDRVSATTLRRAAREALQGSQFGKTTESKYRLASSAAMICMMAIGALLPTLHFAPIPQQSWDAPPVNALESFPAAPNQQAASEQVASLSLMPVLTEEKTSVTTSKPFSPSIELENSPEPIDQHPEITSSADIALRAGGTKLPTEPDPIEKLVTRLSVTTSSDNAIRQLLSAWGESSQLSFSASPCDAIEALGLRCLYGQGQWNELRLYNRPVILFLKAQGPAHQVLMRSLQNETATLEIDGSLLRISLTALDSLWNGEYLLFWRLQTSHHLIGPGSWGEPVQWLHARLALAEDSSEEPLPNRFDRALEARVKRFQRANNLEPDGLVGARTMLLLNNLMPAPGTPLLMPPVAHKAL